MTYLIVAIFLYLTLYTYIVLAKKAKIIDTPNHRSSHSNITIRGGGIIFPLAILLSVFIGNFQSFFFLTGLLIISLISFWDDIRPLSAKIRFVFHLISILLMLYEVGFNLIPLWSWPFLTILIAGIINAYNFMDGINGITGSYSLSILVSFLIINNTLLHFIPNEFIILISLAVLVFLIFNFRKKALCFAGDIGSVSIAYILIYILLKLIVTSNNPIYLLFFSVYGIDATITILLRIKNKENIFEAHRTHLYQILSNEYKLSHLLVSSGYALIQLLICGIITLSIYNAKSQYIVWIIGTIILLVLVSSYYYIRCRLTKRFS